MAEKGPGYGWVMTEWENKGKEKENAVIFVCHPVTLKEHTPGIVTPDGLLSPAERPCSASTYSMSPPSHI